MIKLQLKAEFENPQVSPFVIKVFENTNSIEYQKYRREDLAIISRNDGYKVELETTNGKVSIVCLDENDFVGDVFLLEPSQKVARRLFRRASNHNTFLITERCDQICMMCSQPPRDIDSSWVFSYYEKALCLVDEDSTIGFSGGEPTLYKKELFEMILNVYAFRSDLTYHILSNCQHFDEEDVEMLTRINKKINITWGIPLYSYSEKTHDDIVGKPEAYNKLLNNLYLLASTGARIELRTVLMSKNILDLQKLAKFIKYHLSFINIWAIMALEPIGFAKANRDLLFFDHSLFSMPLENAVGYARLNNIDTVLYNMPLCTLPASIRSYSAKSISDWKQKYLSICDNCSQKESCCGFFEWYTEKWKWSNIEPI